MVLDQRAREAEPAAHPAGELAGLRVGLRLEGRERQQLPGPLLEHPLGDAEVSTEDHQVLRAAEVGVEAIELADHPDPVLRLPGLPRDVVAEHDVRRRRER